MKWIALLFVLGLLPVAIGWLRGNPQQLPRVMMGLGLAQFFSGILHLTVAPISWAMWPGFNKGLELSVVDAISVVVIAAAPARSRVANLRWPIGLFAIPVLFSATRTDVPMPTLFYAWQLGRVALLVTAVAIACRDPRTPKALLQGLIFGLAYQAVMSINERAHGVVQAAGTFGHQNLLGMITHFVVFPSLALLLATKKIKWMWLGPASGGLIAILAASRATIGLAGLGYVLLFGLSLLRHSTARKRKGAMLAIAAMTIAAPLAYATLGARFEKAPLQGDYDERAAFEKAATAMLHDYPFGVGANHYVIVANTQGYSSRAGVAPVFGSRSAHVHNVYLLTAAETGYAGAVTFTIMMLWPIIVALRCAWRFRRDPRGELLVGAAAALIVVAVHSMYEWIFVLATVQYLYATLVGIIAGLCHQMGYWTPVRRRRAAARPTPDDDDEARSDPVPA